MKGRWRVFLVSGFFLLASSCPLRSRSADWLWFGKWATRTCLPERWRTGTLGSLAMAVAFVSCSSTRIAMRWCPAPDGRHTAKDPRDLPRSTPHAASRDGRRGGAAVLFGLFGSGQWQEWLLFRYAQPFGDVDRFSATTSASTSSGCLSGSAQRIARAGPARGVITGAVYVLAGRSVSI